MPKDKKKSKSPKGKKEQKKASPKVKKAEKKESKKSLKSKASKSKVKKSESKKSIKSKSSAKSVKHEESGIPADITAPVKTSDSKKSAGKEEKRASKQSHKTKSDENKDQVHRDGSKPDAAAKKSDEGKHHHHHHHRKSEEKKKRKSSAKGGHKSSKTSVGAKSSKESKAAGSKAFAPISGDTKGETKEERRDTFEAAHIDVNALKKTVIGGDDTDVMDDFQEHLQLLETVEKRKIHRHKEVAGEHTHLVNIRGQLGKVRKGHEKEFTKKPVPARYQGIANQPAVPPEFAGWPTSPFDMTASRLSPGAVAAQSGKAIDRPYTINPAFFQREYDIGMLLNLKRAEKSPWMQGQLPNDIEEKENYILWLRSRPKIPSDVRVEIERNSLSDRVKKMYQGRNVVQPAEHIADIYRQHSSGRLDPRSREELEDIYAPKLRRQSSQREIPYPTTPGSSRAVPSEPYRRRSRPEEISDFSMQPQARHEDQGRRDSDYYKNYGVQNVAYNNNQNKASLQERIRRTSNDLKTWANKLFN